MKVRINIGIFSDFPHLETLINLLESEGHNVYVFKEGTKNFIDETTKTIYVKAKKNKSPYKFYKSINFNNKFTKEIAKLNLSVLHVDLGTRLQYFAYKIARILNIKICAFLLEDFLRNVLDKDLVNFNKFSDEISVENESLKEELKSRNIKRFINVTRRGLELKPLEYSSSDTRNIVINLVEKYKLSHFGKVILLYDRFLSENDIKKVMRIFNDLVVDNPKARYSFFFVSEDNTKRNLIESLESKQLKNKVYIFSDIDEDLVNFAYLADIYLDYSTLENTSDLHKEILSTKTVCLTRKNDLIIDNENGYTYLDDTELFTKIYSIFKLATSERKRIIKNALKTLEDYSLDKYYKRVMIVYNRAIRKGF